MGNLGSTTIAPTTKAEQTPSTNNTPSLALARLLPLGGSREIIKGRILTAEEAQAQQQQEGKAAQEVAANVARGKGRI